MIISAISFDKYRAKMVNSSCISKPNKKFVKMFTKESWKIEDGSGNYFGFPNSNFQQILKI